MPRSNGVQVDAIYTDLSKAFDKLNHTALLYKLRCSGIKGSLYRWFASYLKNRTQIVFLRNARSRRVHSSSGVPQGSNLGPLLFILFINDLRRYLDPELGVSLFADDCKLYCRVSTLLDCMFLQKNLSRFYEYCKFFHLTLNFAKCQKITFCRSAKNRLQSVYNFDNEVLTETAVVKDLGVLLDSRLDFQDHISTVCGKALKMLGFIIRTCKPFRNVTAIKTTYYSLVRSHLEYGVQVWNPTQIYLSDQIERIQKRFVRFVFNQRLVNWDFEEFHYFPVLEALEMRSLCSRRSCADVFMLLKMIFGQLPGSSLDHYMRSSDNLPNLRTHRLLEPTIGLRSSINRFIEKFNEYGFDVEQLLRGSFETAKRHILNTIPNF